MRPYSPLAKDDELALARRWRDHGDISARDRIALAHLPLSKAAAHRYSRLGIPREDLEQEAFLGLLRAADRFDPDMGFRFATYARGWVLAFLSGYVIATQKTVRLPQKMAKAGKSTQIFSLDSSLGAAPSYMDTVRTFADTLPDTSPLPDELAMEAVDGERRTARLSAAIASLAPRDRAVIEARFSGEVSTLDKIGKSLGISKERVRQIECAALKQLKKMLAREVAA